MLKNRYSVTGNSLRLRSTPQNPGSVSRVQKVEASLFPTGTGTTPISMMPAGGVYYNRLFTGILPEMEESLIPYYRDAYRFDSVAGATVDIIGAFPFSDWTLTGVNTDAMKPFNDTLSRLNIRSLLPEISNTYLVDGAFIGSLVYDARTSTFQDILVHDRLNCTITPQPFFALDPVITANTAQYLNNFVHSNSPYAQRIMETYPKAMLDTFMQGQTVLDPITTVFIPRKTMMDEPTTSYLKRILPFYVLKKIMYRATLIEASKRMRATTHVQMGTDTWEPTPKEMQQVLAQFQLSEMDPLGAWVVTRQGVQVQDIRQAGDFWKWTDIIDTLIPHELRALGISEAFLAGDAAYACLAGNTLIPTSEGLKRIDSFGEGKDRKKIVPIKATIDSRYGKGEASSWQYNGYQDTFRIITSLGNELQATGNHPVLVFDLGLGKTEWRRTDQLKVGDLLCASLTSVCEETRLTPDYDDALPSEPWIHNYRTFLTKESGNRNTTYCSGFRYADFDEGKYDNFLHFLKDLSPEAHAKFLLGMKYRYRYTPIVRIEDAGKEHVYDISMKAGTEPAFVANGLVVHNTAETAMTVFLENMDAYRNFVTFKLFTSKLFPLIAVMNSLYKEKGKAKPNTTIEGLMHNLGDRSNLLLPDLQWHKKLITKDTSEMDLLDKLSEKGVPIPLKMLASTAGVDLQSLLQDLEEDKKIRGAISKITGQPISTPGPQGGDEGMGYEEGSLRELEAKAEVWSAVNGVLARRRSLLQRDFGELGAPLRMSKSGNKVHSVYNERATVRKFDEMTAKAAQNLKDPNVRAAARKRVLKAWGHIPNIIK